MKLKGKKVFFVRICGTGVSSVALICKQLGAEVIGVDISYYPPVSDTLRQEEIPCFNMDQFDRILTEEKPDMIVVGNALSGKSQEAEKIITGSIPYYSMPSFIETFLLPDHSSIVVAGTHGKTTTTAMIAEALSGFGEEVSYIIGGIPLFSMKNAHYEPKGYFVLEGDEYDTAFFDKSPKFLHYAPDISIITSIEFDHADIYNSIEEIFVNFKKLVELTKNKVILSLDYENNRKLMKLFPRDKFFTYSIHHDADCIIQRTRIKNGKVGFACYINGEKKGEFSSSFFGNQNRMNLAALFSVLHLTGLPVSGERIGEITSSLKGVKRRQELIGTISCTPVYSDFAHHPTAVHYTLKSFIARYKTKNIALVFDPATNSNSRSIFEKDYIKVLSDADHICIGKPSKLSRTSPEDQFVPERVVKAINQKKKDKKAAIHLGDTDEIVSWIVSMAKRPDTVIIIMSNSGFGGVFDKLKLYFAQLVKRVIRETLPVLS